MTNQRAIDAEKLANDILTFVNSCDYDADTFAKTIARGHKALQQPTMKLFIEAIREMAKVYPDDRNKQTVELTKKITEFAESYSLPLI